MINKDIVYLKHIRDAILDIEKYLGDNTYSSLEENSMLLDAIVRKLEIIGEATNNLSSNFKNSHPEIVYRDIIDMRNFLIHEYFGISTKIVWDTCKTDLPKLKKSIITILS